MIVGEVNLLRQPAVSVVVIAANDQRQTIEANVDTGFSGDLTLPISAIERLAFPLATRSNSYRIGSGALVTFNTYDGTILWHNSRRQVTVLESEITPTIGVGLLWDSNLSIDFRLGGEVTITELTNL